MNIAARYARALFMLGGDEQTRGTRLETLSAVCTTPQILAFWQQPGVALAARQELAKEVATQVDANDQQLRNLLLLLVERQRVKLLPAIATCYSALVKQKAGIVDVTVTASHPLTASQQEEIKKTVAAQLQKQINMTFTVDAKILGGLIVAWEHKVWDFSLRTKLQAIVKHAVR